MRKFDAFFSLLLVEWELLISHLCLDTQVPGSPQTQAGIALPERSREKAPVRSGIYADIPIGNLINYGQQA